MTRLTRVQPVAALVRVVDDKVADKVDDKVDAK